eukprot:g1143.t1
MMMWNDRIRWIAVVVMVVVVMMVRSRPVDAAKSYAPSQGCAGGEVYAPKIPVPDTIVANGCGPQGMQIPEEFGLHVCCNRHDLCYQSCGTTFRYCEKMFKSCLNKVCKKYSGGTRERECREQADTFSGLTAMFGDGFHKSSQDGVCDCVPEDERSPRYRKFLEHVHERSGGRTEEREAYIEELSQKYEKKKGQMVYRALKKHQGIFVSFDNIKDEL